MGTKIRPALKWRWAAGSRDFQDPLAATKKAIGRRAEGANAGAALRRPAVQTIGRRAQGANAGAALRRPEVQTIGPGQDKGRPPSSWKVRGGRLRTAFAPVHYQQRKLSENSIKIQ